MGNYDDDYVRHRKKSKKKTPKKSDHEHKYELIETEQLGKNLFNNKFECQICGKLKEEFSFNELDEK